MKILHVITTVGTGGAERMLLNIVGAKKAEPRVHHGVVALRRGGMLAQPLREAGADVWNCGLSAGERSLSAAFAIRRVIKSFAPDLVQGWMYHGNLAACLAKTRYGASPPLIWGIHHTIDDLTNEKRMTRGLIRLGARLSVWPCKIIYVSRVSRRHHEALGYCDQRSTIIPNGFDCTRFYPQPGAREEVRRSLGLRTDAILLANVAVVRPMKDHANLVTACKLVQRRGLDFHLALIGQRTTEDNRELMRLIESAGLRERVLLLGERHDMPRLMAALDGLVVSSAWGEAFPIVLGEAMASGVPCVTTDVGDSARIVGDTGIVVPPRDPEALAEGMGRLIGMDAENRKRLGMHARARVEECFSLTDVVEQYYRLYEELDTKGDEDARLNSTAIPRSEANPRFWLPSQGVRKIVVIGSFADSLVRFRGNLLKAMADRGHDVVACAPEASSEVREALAKMQVTYRDVRFDRAGLNPIEDARSLSALVILFRDMKPDVVLSYTIKPVIYASLAARITGVPAIFSMITGASYAFTVEGGVALRALRFGTRILYKLSLGCNRRVIFQNPDDRALFEKLGLVRSQQSAIVNGSGIDLDVFQPTPLPLNISFLLIARFLRDKGVLEYVEAARLVKARHTEIAFRLVGWVDKHPTAIEERQLHSWVTEGVVEYLGRLDDVRPAITASSVYVLPSHQEGTPRTVLEAMAMGRPIVTTDAPGCRETVSPGQNGFLVPVRNAVALAAALEEFIKKPDLIAAMGRESRRIAEAKYDVHEVNRSILEAMGLV